MESCLFILGMAWKILFIVFFFGFCIFIHEFGHLLVAKLCGLQVDRFSIGFGKKLWGKTICGVECIISLLPFGGYVALPQIDLAETPNGADGKPLPPAKPIPRALTAFAGPLFNILFGFLLATVMWLAGVWVAPTSDSCVVTAVPSTLPLYPDKMTPNDKIIALDGQPADKYLEELCQDLDPQSGRHTLTVLRNGKQEEFEFQPTPNPEWEAGLRKGDRIIALNGKRFTRGAEELRDEYVYNGGPRLTLTVLRAGQPHDFTYMPMPNPLVEGLGLPFFTYRNPVVVRQVTKDSAAWAGGLRAGDQVLQLDQTNILGGNHFYETATANLGHPFTLLVSRDGKDLGLGPFTCADEAELNSFGLSFAVSAIEVLPDSPGEKAGVQPGDYITAVDGQPVMDSAFLTNYIRNSQGKIMTLTIQRDSKEILLPEVQATLKTLDDGSQRYMIGIVLSDSSGNVIGHPSPWRQFAKVASTTGRTLKLLFAPLGATITRQERAKATVSVRHMSGPLGIVLMLWHSLKTQGIRGGLSLIILISFSLAFINLLPLPVLDGGHILFAFIELAIRRRLPVKLVSILQNTFAALIITLFLYITFFDGKRAFKLTKSWLQEDKEAAVLKADDKKPAVPAETPPAKQETPDTEESK
ncbi:MAG: site-2 protease family protein [Victivallales bacterium]|nr:site-2 protease family protein [Victivallales bacterium]